MCRQSISKTWLRNEIDVGMYSSAIHCGKALVLTWLVHIVTSCKPSLVVILRVFFERWLTQHTLA